MTRRSGVLHPRPGILGRYQWTLPLALAALSACTGEVSQSPMGTTGGTGTVAPGTGGGSTTPGGGASPGAGGTGSGATPGSTGGTVGSSGSSSTTGGTAAAPVCQVQGIRAGRAPLRRLTHFEYNNTVRDLLGDTTNPGNTLPAQQSGNGFGNDAEQQTAAGSLVSSYSSVAEQIANRATADATALGKLASCASNVAAANEESCAKTIIENITPKAFRRTLVAGEVDELLAIYKAARPDSTFAVGVSTVLQAILQSPDFLYRPEFGVQDPANAAVRRLTGDEIATRMSYLLWGSMPDDTLRAAAKAGTLNTKEGVLAQAQKMLEDSRGFTKNVVRFFFDNYLPLSTLNSLERDKVEYPTFTPTIGGLLRTETQRFIEAEYFEANSTWPAMLTAPYTYLNGPLASYYGVTGVQGDTFQKVNLDTTKRMGILLQGSFAAGTSASNHTNPVVRGAFVMHKLLCFDIPAPPSDLGDQIKPPDPYSAPTARQRYAAHSADPLCATCHQYMDPVGFALENFDAVGLYRTTEQGQPIDVSGGLPGYGDVSGPVDLVKKIAATEDAPNCFAAQWGQYAYGVTFKPEDACAQEDIQAAFKKSGYKVKQLLLDLTQTDAFHYMPAKAP